MRFIKRKDFKILKKIQKNILRIILKKYLDDFFKDNNGNFKKLEDKNTGWLRLNRTDLRYRFNKFYDPNLKYTDFHMPVPYSRNKRIINKVFERHFNH